MIFGVIGCPQCRRVQVVDGTALRAHCRCCSRSFAVADRKKFYLGEDPEEARRVAAQVSLQAQGAPAEAAAEASLALERERRASLEDVLDRLRQRPEFGVGDVEDLVLEARLMTTGVRVVESLRQANRVFEPRPGRFRWIG